MIGDVIDTEYKLFLILWLLVPVTLFWLHSGRGRVAGFLVYSYFLNIFMAHWLGALAHASPWSPFTDSADTVSGFRLSTYGILAMAAGALCVPTAAIGRQVVAGSHYRPQVLVSNRRVYQFAFVGLMANILAFTPVGSLPSAGAVIGAGKQCLMLGLSLLCWNAWHERDFRKFYGWLGLAFLLPVFTVITQGFIGYGIVMLGLILLFVAMFYRPRWLILAGLLFGIYGALCVWVAYASNRDALREQVWGGQGAEASFGIVQKMYQSLGLFDFSDAAHLRTVDIRLNQNWLVGKALLTTPHFVPFQDGRTILDAVYAVIPRAIWADKPAVGGSGNYVAQHTMISFALGTSVGMGQVLEFYINFGVPGVVVGFFLLGVFLRYLDIRFTQALLAADAGGILFFYIVGTSALQAGGSLSEAFAAVAGAIVLAFVLVRYFGIGQKKSAVGFG